MSEYERNKGILSPVNLEGEELALYASSVVGGGDAFDTLMDDPNYYGHAVINGKLYEFEAEETDDEPEYCKAEKYVNGKIKFESYHYNGGGGWEEMVEEELAKKDNSK